MRNIHRQRENRVGKRSLPLELSGFSLLELMVALAIFMVIGGAAAALMTQHVPIFVNQQSQVALNFGLRNAVTQMQLDVSNAGDGFYQAADTPGWPIGVTVDNKVYATGCWNATTFVYSSACFDSLNIITADRLTPASHPCITVTTAAPCPQGGSVRTDAVDLYLAPVAPTTATALRDFYKAGDQILLVTNDGTQMTTAKLTANATLSANGAYVHLVHGATMATGANPCPCPNANDPYMISTNADATGLGLSVTFDTNDWVIKLAPTKYYVDAATKPKSPRLMRQQAATTTQAATNDIIAEQIIGFKVGVSLWNGTGDADYNYAVSNLTDFTKVRAVRISLIGRTPPTPANKFRNTFDGGPYKIEAVSVVVNPRSLSMKDK